MKLADLLSNMIAAGATLEDVSRVVEASRRQDDASEQRRRELTLARVRKHRNARNASNAGNALQSVTTDAHVHEGAPAGQITTKTTDLDLNKTPPTEGQKPAKSKPDRKTRIASDAQPAEKDRDLIEQFGLDQPTFRHEWAKFRSYHAARGTTMVNWTEAWRKWLLGWVEDGRQTVSAKPSVNGHHARAGPRRDPDEIVDTMTRAALDIARELSH